MPIILATSGGNDNSMTGNSVELGIRLGMSLSRCGQITCFSRAAGWLLWRASCSVGRLFWGCRAVTNSIGVEPAGPNADLECEIP